MRGYPRGGRPLLAEVFHIPQPDGAGIALDNLQPFVTTHGTLYALFPSRAALQAIAHLEPHVAYTAQPRRTNSEVAYAQAGYAQVAASPHASKTANGAANTIDAATAPNDRFCDVVMEGGVTSGIIYSSAVEQLAKDYRFRNIGGSSIGAFAAALTAAAEYRRRKGEIDAFRYLAELPDKLAEEKKDATEEDKHAPEQDVCKAREAERRRNEDKGKTLLLRMFRPQPATRRLFEIFLSILGNKSTISRVRDGLAAALRQYRVVVLLAVVATLVLVLAGPLAMTWHGLSASPLSVQVLGWVSWGFALLTALASAVVVALLLALLWDFGHGVVGNGFGLCRGWTKGQSADVVDLTWFMHVAIQEAAGRHPIDDPPLTFKDLWDAPGNPADVLGYKGNGDDWRSINLEVYATNLAHGRPYRFPLDEEDDMGRLFFRIDELENYFPGPLLQHLVQYAETYRPKKLNVDPERIKRPEEYLELPRENHDTTMMRMPGVRDRVVRVLLKPGEGGVNINMSGEEIKHLAECYGKAAAAAFVKKFADEGSPGWPEHRWVRFNRLLISLRRQIEGFRVAANMNRYSLPLEAHIDRARADAPLRGPWQSKDAADSKETSEANRASAIDQKMIKRHQRLRLFLRTRLLQRIKEASGTAASVKAAKGTNAAEAARAEKEIAPSEAPLSEKQAQELKDLLDALLGLESMFETAGDHKPYIAVPRPSLRVRHPT